MINFDLELFKKVSKDIFTCDSPTGFTHNVIKIIENYIKEYGYNTIFWSIAYKDWETNKTKDINVSVNSVIDNLHNGAIILLHTVSNENVIALPIIIDKIREEGYEIASLNDFVIPNYNLIY